MTRRYKSFKSDVANRPPSSGTSGRRSGGSTGSTVMTIHSGLLFDSKNDSSSFKRFDSRLILVSEFVPGDLVTNLVDVGAEVHGRKQVADGLGAHSCVEFIAILLDRFEVGLVGEQLAALQRRHAGVDHDEGFEVQNPLDLAQRHIEHEADARRQRLQEPDVRDRARELDVAHALAAHFGLRDLDAALLADDAAVLQALVLAAQALVVLDRPEDLRAEQSVALRLERPVVDGFRLLDLTVRPRADHVRRGKPNPDQVEVFDRALLFE